MNVVTSDKLQLAQTSDCALVFVVGDAALAPMAMSTPRVLCAMRSFCPAMPSGCSPSLESLHYHITSAHDQVCRRRFAAIERVYLRDVQLDLADAPSHHRCIRTIPTAR